MVMTVSDRDPGVLSTDDSSAAALPGGEEQDLDRGPAAVGLVQHDAVAELHQFTHEPSHAVQKGETLRVD